MPITVALAIGFDPWLLASRNSAWRSAGCFVTEAGSVAEAIDELKRGDFDVVLLDHSIPPATREGVTSLVRASGSLVPVVCLTDPLDNSRASSTSASDPDVLLQRIAGHVATPEATHAGASETSRRGTQLRLNLPRTVVSAMPVNQSLWTTLAL